MAEDEDALTRLRAVLPVTSDVRRRNVAHALSLGLPELEQHADRAERLTILASGMSFFEAPRGIAPAMAVNGALGLMATRGERPAWWVGYDPQALLADFIIEAGVPEVTYLIASTCHPDVFDLLKNRDVRLWHASDDDGTQNYGDLIEGRPHVLRMPSVTLMAIQLAGALGFARSQTWGWDGCFRGRRHHANDQKEERDIVAADVGGVIIPTTRTWLYELGGARGLFSWCPRDVHVHGDGLFARALTGAGFVNQPTAEAA